MDDQLKVRWKENLEEKVIYFVTFSLTEGKKLIVM
jgi:hypothetical protein